MKPLILCIMDGVGIRKEKKGNALKIAKMPTLNRLMKKYPNSLLDASGVSVGLPDGQMGNSEVGHTNIGAGRVVYQPLEIINRSIKDKTIFTNIKLVNFLQNTKKLHILGLLSDGGIHSDINHLFTLMDIAKLNGVEELYIHIFTDGRDTLSDCSIKYIEQLEKKIEEIGIGEISSISGRYYAMDRDNNYDRLKLEYDVLTKNIEEVKNYKEYIQNCYQKQEYDEFIKPIKVTNKGTIENNDKLITFNFRPDRLRELFSSLTNPSFNKFETNITTNLLTMFPVSDEVIYDNIFELPNLNNCFGPYIDSLGLKQLRIAETEKYAHVTYFFDGGRELELKNSKRILIPSSKVATYDLKPEMSATEITNALLKELDKDYLDVVILNFANGDMVGHTGNFDATVKSLEVLDNCLKEIYEKVLEKEGTLVITADHGNCDYMTDGAGNKITSHSKSKVPFIITNKSLNINDGKLADIAPTLLYLLGLKIPEEMTGNILINKRKKSNKKIFILISFIIFFASLFIYSYRLIHYYRIEHPHVSVKDNTLVTKIIEDNEIVSTGDGLQTNDSNYIFYGNNVNNYVYYSNQLWKIIRINKDNSITLITDSNVSSLVYSYESNNFKDSYINNWLNNKYYKSLNNANNYIIDYDYCINGGKTKKENCKKTVSTKIGLLSYSDYILAGANKSYLNNNSYFWTITPSNNKNYYVFNEGGINDESNSNNSYYGYGVRPVITIRNDIEYLSGTGTSDDPYKFANDEVLGIGSYINYSNYTFRIINKDDSKYTLALADTLGVKHIFSNKTSIFKKNDYNSLYAYLNSNFYYRLDKKLIVDGNWYTGFYNLENKYDYSSINSNEISSKVGLLNVSDLFTTDVKDYYTSTPYSDDMIYTINSDGNLYASDIDEELNIRPTICLTIQINVVSGVGSINDPYIVEGVQ